MPEPAVPERIEQLLGSVDGYARSLAAVFSTQDPAADRLVALFTELESQLIELEVEAIERGLLDGDG